MELKNLLVLQFRTKSISFFIFQTPSRLEPVLADKEVLLTALNIKAMTFTGLDQDESETEEEDEDEIKANGTAG